MWCFLAYFNEVKYREKLHETTSIFETLDSFNLEVVCRIVNNFYLTEDVYRTLQL